MSTSFQFIVCASSSWNTVSDSISKEISAESVSSVGSSDFVYKDGKYRASASFDVTDRVSTGYNAFCSKQSSLGGLEDAVTSQLSRMAGTSVPLSFAADYNGGDNMMLVVTGPETPELPLDRTYTLKGYKANTVSDLQDKVNSFLDDCKRNGQPVVGARYCYGDDKNRAWVIYGA